MLFMLCHAFSLFIVGGSSHMVSDHFPWHKWEFFFLFKKRGKNWAVTFRSLFETFYIESEETGCISEFLFQKYTVSKKNHLIWSPKSGDITDLKSVIFQNFGDSRGNCGEKIFRSSAHIFILIS